MLRITVIVSALYALLLLQGCGTTNAEDYIPDRRPDYRKNQNVNPLEVPPDLTSSTIDDTLLVPELNPEATANLSDYAADRSGAPGNRPAAGETVLQQSPELQIRREGTRRWLLVNQPATALWPQVKSFWTENGFRLNRDDPRIGILETDWLENRADIPEGPVRAVLKRFLDFAYSAPTRDKFRVRLEPAPGQQDSSEIFLTHYGVEEVATGREGESLVWQPRERDPELEAEMLSRLMVHLGAEQRRARAKLANADGATGAGAATDEAPRTQLVDTADGYRALVIQERYDRAWRMVGLALDGSDYAIEDQNRSQGLYLIGPSQITANPKNADEGLLTRLAFWRDDDRREQIDPSQRYRVRLAGRGPQTLVVVQTNQGQPDNSPAAEKILQSVQQVIQ